MGDLLGQDEALIWTRSHELIELESPCKPQLNDPGPLVPIFTRILSPQLSGKPLQDPCQCELASLALKVAFAHSFCLLMKNPVFISLSLSKYMHANKKTGNLNKNQSFSDIYVY